MKLGEKMVMVIWGVCTVFAVMVLPFSTTPVEAQTVKLKYGSYASHAVYDDVTLWFLDEVSKRSGIKIEVETYFGGTLAKPPDCLDAIGKGVYDIGWISPVFTTAKVPLGTIPGGTPLVAPTPYVASKAADELVRTFPAAGAEYEKANTKFLFHYSVPPYDLICKKPVKSLEDIKGLRVRTFGYYSKAWAQLGGVPVNLANPEQYDGLQKGVLDGALSQPDSMYNVYHLSEVARHFTKMNMGCVVAPILMNMGTWNKLPEKVRKEMLELALDMPPIVEKMINDSQAKAMEGMKKEGISFYELQAGDKARIKAEAKVLTELIVGDLTAKGVSNAKEAMEIYLANIEKYAK